MIKQTSGTSKLENTVSALVADRTRHDTVLFIVLLIMVLTLTPLLAFWGVSAGLIVLGVLVAPFLAFALMRWPMLGFYFVAFCVFAIESDPLPVHIATDNLPIFFWTGSLAGIPERPIGFVMLFALFAWLVQRFIKRQPMLKGGALIWPFTFYIFCVICAVVYGMATGGDSKLIITQIRPFWYTFLTYILAYNFFTRKKDVRGFFWLAIVSAGFKGLQGLYVYLIVYQGDLTGHDTIMSHEESFFYAALLLLLVIFALYYSYRPQLIACCCVAPFVIISFLGNQRRTDYIALLLGIGFAWTIIYLIKPKARRALMTGMITCAVLGISYVAIFAGNPSSIGGPARAVIGVFAPTKGDSRDALSNLYRDFENADLSYTAKHHPLGLGFGKLFDEPKPLTIVFPDILTQDPVYNFVPHNTIYWIWADMGAIGFFSLWFLFGSIIVRGCFIARQLKDPYLQVIAIFIVGATAMEVTVAFADYQLFFFRNVMDLGLLAGLLVKLPILDKEQKESVGEDTSTSIQQKGNFKHESIDGVSVLS